MINYNFLKYAFGGIVVISLIGWLTYREFHTPKKDYPTVTIYKNSNCNCCSKWAAYLTEKGFETVVIVTDTLQNIKSNLAIPKDLRSCHTAIIGNYIIEGHVPAFDIISLLHDKPPVKGLFVPGMPIGSPGMEGNYNEPFYVYLLRRNGTRLVYSYNN